MWQRHPEPAQLVLLAHGLLPEARQRVLSAGGPAA